MRTRSVAVASPASAAVASSVGVSTVPKPPPSPMKWSATHTPSHPVASACRATSTTSVQGWARLGHTEKRMARTHASRTRAGFLPDRVVWLMCFVPAPPRLTVLAAVQGVAAGAPLDQTFQMLTDAIVDATEGNAGIGIRWVDADGRAHLYGDLDPTLGGLTEAGEPDDSPGSPWREASETGRPARRSSLDELAPDVAAAAGAAEFAGCCVSPVADPATGRSLLYFTWVRHPSQLDYVEQTFDDILADVLDIALQRAHDQAQLVFAARHDQLTGLPARGVFFAKLADALTLGSVSVLYLDLDGFKHVNDVLGHHAGDHVLPAVARRLRSSADEVATVARLGGDEFGWSVGHVLAVGDRGLWPRRGRGSGSPSC